MEKIEFHANLRPIGPSAVAAQPNPKSGFETKMETARIIIQQLQNDEPGLLTKDAVRQPGALPQNEAFLQQGMLLNAQAAVRDPSLILQTANLQGQLHALAEYTLLANGLDGKQEKRLKPKAYELEPTQIELVEPDRDESVKQFLTIDHPAKGALLPSGSVPVRNDGAPRKDAAPDGRQAISQREFVQMAIIISTAVLLLIVVSILNGCALQPPL